MLSLNNYTKSVKLHCMKTVTSEGITTMNKQTRRDAHLKMTSRFIVLLISILMVMSSTVLTFAAGTQVGTSGDPFAGAATNTFAQNMNLQQIYLDQSVLVGAENSPQASFTSTAIAQSTDSAAKGVYLKASEMPTITDGKGSKNFTDVTWSYTYPEAAILPDGSKKNVIVTYTLDHIDAAQDGDVPFDTPLLLTSYGCKVSIYPNTTNADQKGTAGRALKVYITSKVEVADAESGQTFLVPLHGVNADKQSAKSHKVVKDAFPEETPNGTTKSVVESVKTSKDVYYPGNASFDTSSTDEYYGKSGNKDTNYTSGMVFEGGGDRTIQFGGIVGQTTSNSYSNNMTYDLGDLQHRIWSGSGPNGKIETGKTGTGTDLDGGKFTGAIPSGMPATNTDEQELMRYVVPDAKENVTYTMRPTTDGFFADKVSVDGKTIQIPVSKKAGDTWTFDAGILEHKGNDLYTFTFNKPNASDHSIYVTWRTTPTADDATSIDGKGVTQTGTPVFVPAEGQEFNPGDFILIDDDGKEKESITVPGEGKYTVDKQTGKVTFVPEPDYVGTAKGVTVRGTQEDGQTAEAKYTPTVVETDQTKTVTRNVTFTYKTEDGKTASKTVTQTLTFKRTGKYNKETGQVDYPDWEPQTFPAVKAPEIEGWTPNMAEAPALTVLDPNIKVADVHIVYNKIEGDEAGEGVDTGDDNNVKPWVAILLANAMAICALIISRRRRNK